jgi:hypothetical protein
MSLSFSPKSGSRDSLNWRTRCGCSPCARQIRWTELTLMPTAFDIMSAVYCFIALPLALCYRGKRSVRGACR